MVDLKYRKDKDSDIVKAVTIGLVYVAVTFTYNQTLAGQPFGFIGAPPADQLGLITYYAFKFVIISIISLSIIPIEVKN